jgi:uncharacterized protein (DUF169 family)
MERSVAVDPEIKEKFAQKWEKYFPGGELPIASFYADALDGVEYPDAPKTDRNFVCVFGQLTPVRMGKARAFNQNNVGCFGASGMFGFSDHQISGEMGANYDFLIKEEKFYKTAEQVKEIMTKFPPVPARGKYLIFKRWDLLTANDQPLVVSFFCNPDTIAGLHALANYDSMTPHAVIAPFSSGCDTLIGFAVRELQTNTPRAVLGLFDPSARVCVKPDLLTFSIPWPKFISMMENMDKCFLTTSLWQTICKRMKPSESV